MNSETYIDFCFMRKEAGEFAMEINQLLKQIFNGKPLSWYLEEKMIEDTKIIIAEVKGMSNWRSEEETINFLEENAGDQFWQYLQGYKMFIYPVTRGCTSCEAH